MKTLTRWEPFRTSIQTWEPMKELEELGRRLESFFDIGSLLRGNGGGERSLALREWTPPVDITEDEKEFLVKVELPEVKKDEVQVTVENGVLEISGERKTEKEEKEKKYHRIERTYGSFTRAFALPEGVEVSKVAAEFKEGVLRVHLPKNPATKPTALDVKVQ